MCNQTNFFSIKLSSSLNQILLCAIKQSFFSIKLSSSLNRILLCSIKQTFSFNQKCYYSVKHLFYFNQMIIRQYKKLILIICVKSFIHSFERQPNFFEMHQVQTHTSTLWSANYTYCSGVSPCP